MPNKKTDSTTWNKAVGVAQQFYQLVGGNRPGNKSPDNGTPALSAMVKLGTAIGHKMGIPDQAKAAVTDKQNSAHAPASATPSALSSAAFAALGKEAGVQRMQAIMQTMHAPEHPVHKVMNVLGDFTKGKIDRDELKGRISEIGAQLPPVRSAHGRHASLFKQFAEDKSTPFHKQAHGFVQITANKNTAMIVSAHQEMSNRIAAKLKSMQKPPAKLIGK